MSAPLVLLSAPTAHEYLIRPNYWPHTSDFVTWCRNMDPITGAVLIVGGFLFLFSGFKMHRLLVALTAAIIGAYLGAGFAMRAGAPLWIGIPLGALASGAVAWFTTAWAAAVVGAVCGGFVGAAVWNMFELDPRFTWSGALTGMVALGLLCFIIFRISVILFTSLQGAAMLVLGLLGLAYQYPFVRPTLDDSVGAWPYVLPTTILGLMVMGLGYQYLKGPGGGGKAAPARSSAGSDSKKADKKD